MIKDPKISILLPVYNSAEYVSEAIQSMLTQTFKDFELIIINDGSTDDSEKIILSFKDDRIVYVKNESNLGLINTLNIGLNLAKGKFIARMDADDISLPTRLQMQYDCFQADLELVAVSTDYYVLKGNKLSYSANFSESDMLKSILLFATCFAHPTVMMKNVFSAGNLYYDRDFIQAEDYKLWIDLAEIGRFKNINEPLLKYRSHPQQVSVLNSAVQKKKSEIIRELYLRRNGFKFSEEELQIHHLIGNNVFIHSMDQLFKIEIWLSKLISQNDDLKAFEKTSFEKVIAKFWMDSCGYTSLGLKAYHVYFGSEISKLVSLSTQAKIRLWMKCLVRKFKI